ncbi:hypothetical protein OZ410_13620 [Robiginitalea sp. M366]|uniref:hypothetical protein n=1 Tax=Robiginitalea aestuariiviva TaxID=3036903 RepID=UPI00240DF86D|nr:hypothetical protein [Robiginitalea aestuariiviva]MDG1573363.1 hypothetical protein [Robiginitalea aestuariiviva]
MGKTNNLLLLALGIGLAFHGSAIFFTLEDTYDALVHLFFADHYLQHWFEAWEPRWYTGFTVQGYPPLVHQAMAFFAMAGGLKFGLYLMALLAVVLFITGMYRFSLMLTGNPRIAGTAALLATCCSALVETLHLFGQLPSLVGLSLLLHALPEIYSWVRYGNRRYLFRALALIGATVCSHHVTPIFGMVFFIFPTLGMAVMDLAALERGGVRQVNLLAFWRVLRRSLGRLMAFGLPTLVLIVVLILPYWLNSKANPITQVPIPHGSRDNYLEVFSSGLVFFLIPWGALLLFLPYIFYRYFSKRYLFYGLSLALLTLLGTGGTTPLPRMLLGENAFNILTLDRFTLWASMMSLPMLAELVYRYLAGDLREIWLSRYGSNYHRLVGGGFFGAYLFMAVFTMSLGYFRPSQPERINMLPIVNFLNQDMHDHWRYLTLGFGDQMAWLSAQTNALSVDGNYHSARRLPELTSRAVERLENSKYRGLEGLGSLQQFLTVPEKYHLKFIFSNDKFYDPLLYFSGWRRLQLLENGIMVWERAGVAPLPNLLPRPEPSRLLNLWWGVVPPLSALVAYLVCIQWGLTATWLSRRVPSTHPGYSAWSYSGMRRPMLLLSQAWGWVVFAALLLLALMLYRNSLLQASPEKAVQAYYDAVDFKEFEQAHAYLDPEAGLSLDQYLLELSVGDGLLSSYAKLESVRPRVEGRKGNQARVRAQVRYVTPLRVVEQERVHDLVERGGRWYLLPEPRDPDLPPQQWVEQREVSYFNHGRRRVTTQQTHHEDVLRRPRTEVYQTRVLEADSTYSVVGWVQNIDAYPADVTLTGRLLGADGTELARYNAGQVLKHQLLPGEGSPFRVRFQDIAWRVATASKPLTYNPDQFQPLDLAEMPGAFEVLSEGNQATQDLYHHLALEVDTLTPQTLSGTVHNLGIQEATIVQLLISYYDAQGQPLWVDSQYLEASVRVQRRQPFRLELPDLTHLQAWPPDQGNLTPPPRFPEALQAPELLPVPGRGFSYIHVKVNAYVGVPR